MVAGLTATDAAWLFLLLLVFLAAASIVWSTLVAGVSPMPSSGAARDAMLPLLDKAVAFQCSSEGSGTAMEKAEIVELGSGWGNLLIALARRYPQHQIVGYEISWLPWLVSLLLVRLYRLNNVQVLRKNFLKQDLSKASVLVCYLYPGAMQAISEKLLAEQGADNDVCDPGTRFLISNNFALPGFQPGETVKAKDFYQSPVYLYRLKSGGA